MRTLWSLALVAVLAACGSSTAGGGTTPAATTEPPPGSPEVVIRGEHLLEPDAVASFYRARGGRLVWTRPGGIEEVAQAIDDIAADGLTPGDYHQHAIAALLDERKRAPGTGLDTDLDYLVTDAVAALVDHVRYGKVRPVELDPKWNVDPRDGAPALPRRVAKIAAAESPRAAIAKARPDHFIYRGLVGALAELRRIDASGEWPRVSAGRTIRPGRRDARIAVVRRRLGLATGPSRYDATVVDAVKAFQAGHRLEPTGLIDAATIAELNVPASARVDQVRVNLERARWVLGGLSDDFVLVNLPAFKAYVIRDGRKVWEGRTMIGKEARQSPTFRATLRSIVFNPDWTVPRTILAEDVIEGMQRGDNVIARKQLVVLDASSRQVDPASIDWRAMSVDSFPYLVRQPAGPENVLGQVKLEFPNEHAIYMHDTPSKDLFAASDRALSSGCIRVERPLELAALLLAGQRAWTPDKIRSAVDSGETLTAKLDHPSPILIVYWTVSVGVGEHGEIRYARDVYDLDPPLLAALARPPM